MDKSIVLYNVINSKEIIDKAKNDSNVYNYDIVYLGRLTYQKDPIRLLNLLKKVIKKNQNINVAIVGSGDLEDDVKKYISSNNLESNIHYLGFNSNPYKILLSSKMLILTSRFEGTPMVALEAMALGKPIITTPTDGMIKLVENYKNGFISNNDNELIDGIIKLLNDKKLYESMQDYIKERNNVVNNIDEYIYSIKAIYLEK